MDILMTVLRLTHIVAAVVWVGLGVTLFFFVGPAMRKAGPAGLSVSRQLFTGTRLSPVFAVSATLTFLAGLLMYLVGNSMAHFDQFGNIVLGIGAIFGTLAFLHGAFVTGKSSSALSKLLSSLPTDGPPSPDQASALQAMSAKMVGEQRVSAILTLVALVCMAGARYL